MQKLKIEIEPLGEMKKRVLIETDDYYRVFYLSADECQAWSRVLEEACDDIILWDGTGADS